MIVRIGDRKGHVMHGRRARWLEAIKSAREAALTAGAHWARCECSGGATRDTTSPPVSREPEPEDVRRTEP